MSTALKCDCHRHETLAVGNPQEGCISIRDRRHGTSHDLSLALSQIVQMLDPEGTSFQPVGTGR